CHAHTNPAPENPITSRRSKPPSGSFCPAPRPPRPRRAPRTDLHRPTGPESLARPGGDGRQSLEEGRDAPADLVPNPPELVQRQPLRIGQVPLETLPRSKARTLLAAAHHDDSVPGHRRQLR